jgi:hypothetical protein
MSRGILLFLFALATVAMVVRAQERVGAAPHSTTAVSAQVPGGCNTPVGERTSASDYRG